MDGAEEFCRNFLSYYSEIKPYAYSPNLRVHGLEAEFVVFGSQEKLDLCDLDYKFVKREAVPNSNAKIVNKFAVSEHIKAFVEPNTSGYANNKFYILNEVVDESYWNFPSLPRGNYYSSVQPYFSKLVLIDPACYVQHDVFGCGSGCNQQKCGKCGDSYKLCDQIAVHRHTTSIQSGLCLNSGCKEVFPMCQSSLLVAHSREHISPCQSCHASHGSCMHHCSYCMNKKCKVVLCQCRVKAVEVERSSRILYMKCPACVKQMGSRQGLETHFQHCQGGMLRYPWVTTCNCGFPFMDEDHKKKHIEGKKKCKFYVSSPPPPPPAVPRKKTYDDDLMYSPRVLPVQTKTESTSISGFSRSLLREIRRAFEFENSALYTISEPELSHYKNISATVSTTLRTSGIVAETVGFGSADKGTGVPGYVDVDMLVVINNFDPTKRKEYAATFRKLLQDAGANLKYSADDIQQVEFNGVEFDLVLVGANAEDNDKRAAGFAEARHNVRELRAIVKTDNYVKEVIRAVKYWSKRSFPAGGIKSCLIEAIVLAQYTAAKAELTALPSQQQRRLVLFKKFFAFIAASADSAVARSTAVVPGTNGKPSADLVTDLMSTAPITAEQRVVAGQVSQQLLDL